jgi:hypothetical protein
MDKIKELNIETHITDGFDGEFGFTKSLSMMTSQEIVDSIDVYVELKIAEVLEKHKSDNISELRGKLTNITTLIYCFEAEMCVKRASKVIKASKRTINDLADREVYKDFETED